MKNERVWCLLTLALISACGGPRSEPQQAESQPAVVVAVPASAEPPNDAGPVLAETTDATGEADDASPSTATIWGDSIGDAFGAGGLGLSGIGRGAGGTGEGTGLGSIGSIGRGAGTGSTTGGSGSGYGRIGGSQSASRPTVTQSRPVVVGALDKDVIRRVILRSRNRFAYCYERRLATNPTLEGKVVTRFVIGREGKVVSAQDAGSTLPDETVKACVQRTFMAMQFPRPDGGGVVMVTYPLVFRAAATTPPADAGADASSDN